MKEYEGSPTVEMIASCNRSLAIVPLDGVELKVVGSVVINHWQ